MIIVNKIQKVVEHDTVIENKSTIKDCHTEERKSIIIKDDTAIVAE